MRFHLHDSASRKNSESFAKIKEAIVLKIKETFDSPRHVAESISSKVKKVFNDPVRVESQESDPARKAIEDQTNLERWKIDYATNNSDKEKFEDGWVKAFAMIWKN